MPNYESKLKEVDLNKARLEREIDNLAHGCTISEKEKSTDMTMRLDGLYDTIVELEERIEDAKLRKALLKWKQSGLTMFTELWRTSEKLYDIISDEEKKALFLSS